MAENLQKGWIVHCDTVNEVVSMLTLLTGELSTGRVWVDDEVSWQSPDGSQRPAGSQSLRSSVDK